MLNCSLTFLVCSFVWLFVGKWKQAEDVRSFLTQICWDSASANSHYVKIRSALFPLMIDQEPQDFSVGPTWELTQPKKDQGPSKSASSYALGSWPTVNTSRLDDCRLISFCSSALRKEIQDKTASRAILLSLTNTGKKMEEGERRSDLSTTRTTD